MRRRDLIALLGGAGAAWLAVGVRAQHGKTFRLGILVNTRNTALDELLKGLRDHGYVEGQNLIVEMRFSEGAGERRPELAGEVVARKVDAIVVQTTPAALAAKQATSTIPIVITWTFRSFRQAISVQSGRLFRSKPAGCFGPKRHPLPKALGRRLQRTAAEELILACHSHLKQLLLID